MTEALMFTCGLFVGLTLMGIVLIYVLRTTTEILDKCGSEMTKILSNLEEEK